MPVAHLYATVPAEHRAELLERLSAVYAEVLGSPVERIRVYLVEPQAAAVGGKVGPVAPYFTAVVLADRPAAQRAELLRRFTDVLTEVLRVPRPTVRGMVLEAPPENWGIGGTPAATTRAAEISTRSG
ncbi:phenylpyruvate tautomerase MIF-related protein [Pseudonocardia sp. McavD-2-B]|uniref:tautomerase family protein n=1 Tax=Pseudonocardia sp. McavD-2-B TaxID=2954499 RepID=UPI002096E4B1|nr:phenylpyruvate tautomerase MIF-related protein [Pseudonocardia sp. McavD-2-B]MCO7191981.1 phenylpyruvate tautomerase MIF-related protein [Pseudonocardia sp. McavD-2-B]